MKMLPAHGVGSRARYLREQDVFMEQTFGKFIDALEADAASDLVADGYMALRRRYGAKTANTTAVVGGAGLIGAAHLNGKRQERKKNEQVQRAVQGAMRTPQPGSGRVSKGTRLTGTRWTEQAAGVGRKQRKGVFLPQHPGKAQAAKLERESSQPGIDRINKAAPSAEEIEQRKAESRARAAAGRERARQHGPKAKPAPSVPKAAPKPPIKAPFMTRRQTTRAGIAGGLALGGVALARHRHNSKQRAVAGAAAGAGLADATSIVGGATAKEALERHRGRHWKPEHDVIMAAHRKEYGHINSKGQGRVPTLQHSPEKITPFYANYPKNVPGGRGQRLLSLNDRPKVYGGAVALTAGALGLHYGRRDAVNKAAPGWSKDRLRFVGAGGTRMREHLRGHDKLALIQPPGFPMKQVRQARLAAAGNKAKGPRADHPRYDMPTTSRVYGRDRVGKRDYVKTTMSDRDAKHVAGQYGLKGPLPKDLPREERMRAYEGRYLAAGGRKAEHWDRTADRADKVRNGALAAGTAAAAGALASRVPAVRRRLPAALHRPLGKHTETAALGTAVVGGSAELLAGHARKKRASYSGSPGGVAASALRRMQQYTPEP